MNRLKAILAAAGLVLLSPLPQSQAATATLPANNSKEVVRLSRYWPDSIQQWSAVIGQVSETYGLDPDFIAAVVKAESNGVNNAVSRVGAVGLMGIMPAGPGMEWRPSTEELSDPGVNIDWGVAILTEIIRQSGGDISAALAAYSAGWENVNKGVPQAYAAKVLDDYGRAIAARSGVPPEIGARWTVAVEMTRGYIPQETPLLILGDKPVSGFFAYGEHVIYSDTDANGQSYYLKGYAVPVALTVPTADAVNIDSYGSSDTLEPELMQRVAVEEHKFSKANLRVLLTCLPSLSRLRGRVSTRWYAPSFCPSWHR